MYKHYNLNIVHHNLILKYANNNIAPGKIGVPSTVQSGNRELTYKWVTIMATMSFLTMLLMNKDNNTSNSPIYIELSKEEFNDFHFNSMESIYIKFDTNNLLLLY